MSEKREESAADGSEGSSVLSHAGIGGLQSAVNQRPDATGRNQHSLTLFVHPAKVSLVLVLW